MQMRDIVMINRLKNEAEAIRQYEFYHSPEGIWPEVVNAARVSGFEKIRIYRHQTTLVMILTIPNGSDLNAMTQKYGASSAKLSDWSALMCSLMSKTDATWEEMAIIHCYEDGQVKKCPNVTI